MATAQNHLIELLERKDRLHLLGLCESVPLVRGAVLCEPAKPIRHVYFPIDGFISLVAPLDGKPGLEVGLVGREGMLGSQLVHGVVTSPLHALVQGSGSAWRMDAKDFRGELARNAAAQRVMNCYLYVLMAQLATSAVCVRFHQIGPRLARRLLMSQDRAHADSFPVTQELLGYMLGVRRVGITAAARALQREGLIKYHRGGVTVLDRSGLEAAACGCYAIDRQAYDAVLP